MAMACKTTTIIALDYPMLIKAMLMVMEQETHAIRVQIAQQMHAMLATLMAMAYKTAVITA
jgi:hypothetical protein